MEILVLIVRYFRVISGYISYIFLSVVTIYLIYNGIHDKIKHVNNDDDYTIRR